MKRFFAVLLVLALFCAGCNPSTDIDDNNGDVIQDGGNRDPFGKYEEPLLVTGVMEYTALTDNRVPSGTTPDNMAFINIIKDELNVDFQWLWKVPPNQYQQKFGVAMLGGDLPDVMKVYPADYETLKENGQLRDLSDVLDYASDELETYLNRDPSILEGLRDEDGSLYTIPQYGDVRRTVPLMYIRKDWLDKVGMEVPKTPQDLEDVSKAFVTELGAKAGIAMSQDVSAPQYAIGWYMNSLGASPYSWLKQDDGSLIAGEVASEAKEALAWLNGMYEQGLIDREFAIQDADRVGEDVVSGRIGIVFGPWWQYEWPLAMAMNSDREANWITAPLPGEYVHMQRQQIDHYYVVNKRCNNPEVLLKLINMYIALDGTEEAEPEKGYVWDWVPTVYYDPYDINTQFEEINAQLEVDPDAKNPAPDNWTAHAKKIWEAYPQYLAYTKEPDNSQYNTDMFGNIFSRVNQDGAWAAIRETVESHNILYNEYFGTNTETMRRRGATLSKLVNETYLKIIMGETPVLHFDQFVEEWHTLGGGQITEEVNTWYKQYGAQELD